MEIVEPMMGQIFAPQTIKPLWIILTIFRPSLAQVAQDFVEIDPTKQGNPTQSKIHNYLDESSLAVARIVRGMKLGFIVRRSASCIW